MRKSVSFTCCLFALSGLSHAATIGWGAQETESLGLASGAAAPQGALVRLGYFNATDSQIKSWAAAGDKSLLTNSFVEFDSATVGANYDLDGVWGKSSTNANPAFAGKQIYMWSFNTPTVTAATQWGIFKSSLPSWTFPSDVPVTGSTNIDLKDVDKNASGLIVGSYGPAVGTLATGGSSIYRMATITTIPEPSTAAFGLLIALGGMCIAPRRLTRR